MVAANTRDCFRQFVGQRLVGLLFDALPVNRADLRLGTTTLIFEDGRGLTLKGNGAHWVESADEVRRAIDLKADELRRVEADIRDVLAGAGVLEVVDAAVTMQP